MATNSPSSVILILAARAVHQRLLQPQSLHPHRRANAWLSGSRARRLTSVALDARAQGVWAISNACRTPAVHVGLQVLRHQHQAQSLPRLSHQSPPHQRQSTVCLRFQQAASLTMNRGSQGRRICAVKGAAAKKPPTPASLTRTVCRARARSAAPTPLRLLTGRAQEPTAAIALTHPSSPRAQVALLASTAIAHHTGKWAAQRTLFAASDSCGLRLVA